MLQRLGDTINEYWQRLPEKVRNIGGPIVLIALLILTPFWLRSIERGSDGSLSLLFSINVALLYVVLALGLNIVVGFAGLLDLGYAAFFALGAYTFGILTGPMHGLEWSFWIAILFVPPVAAFFGILIGAPTLRLRGDYLAIVTLAFGEIVPNALRNFSNIHIPFLGLNHFNLTNGTQGLKPIGKPVINLGFLGIEPIVIGSAQPIHIGGIEVNSQMMWFYLVIAVGALVLFGSRRLDNSRLGRAWKAIREDETAADCMGVNPISTKLLAFALGASFSGIAGAAFASMSQAVFPELFFFNVSIFILIIVIISGMGNVWGVLLGGLILTLFDRVFLAQIAPPMLDNLAEQLNSDFLRNIDLPLYRWVMFGTGLLIIMLLRPEGLFPPKPHARGIHITIDDYLQAKQAAAEAEGGSD